ncbi:amidohydrolase [Granulosicoccus sp.]|nr:amidohydrolase family protein [Granulosicoccus sp.]MDB4222648.1 amidohydrolase [Granulosicoccus sp.]
MTSQFSRIFASSLIFCASSVLLIPLASANDDLPIADTHLHYSHDSVEMTPPERVIELMRSANLKFALVSSSDDNGTQLLSDLAPDLIVPGLRPYRRRGELSTWFTDDAALAYVERLLATNKYASIGEFHLYGENADLEIPRRIVQLAAEHNLILHAHSDADAVERLLAQDPTVKVLWAHSGFESPDDIAAMLEKHDRLWADLAFRSEVGSGGQLSEDWIELFTRFPDRMMLGTDTYTPERMYFVPEHAEGARVWLQSLPAELAERVAWKNGYELIMHQWHLNKTDNADGEHKPNSMSHSMMKACDVDTNEQAEQISASPLTIIETLGPITVSQPFSAVITVCDEQASDMSATLDARMPAHGHGMNYTPEITVLEQNQQYLKVRADGLVLHMPGSWEWIVNLKSTDSKKSITHEFKLQ